MEIVKQGDNVYHRYINKVNANPNEYEANLLKMLLEIGKYYNDKAQFIEDLKNGKSFVDFFQEKLNISSFDIINLAETKCVTVSEKLELMNKIKVMIDEAKKLEELYADYLSYYHVNSRVEYIYLGNEDGKLIPYFSTSHYTEYVFSSIVNKESKITYSEETIDKLILKFGLDNSILKKGLQRK